MSSAIKSYARHDCDKTHRTYKTLAECMFRSKNPYWVSGEGPYALLAWCEVLTISLHETFQAALAARQDIDRIACGSRCKRHHEIIRLRPSLEVRS